ncbi:hypothetical protein BGZ60DRAFT_532567 [Tricladium varicosporioides]|nr:hypothetical protein BGZ60DRAFT_532567 [Hymenoscyphus varicosporioides]
MNPPIYDQQGARLLTPIIAVKCAACLVCFKLSSNLRKCVACKRVAYCSQECQKADWNNEHKSICKNLQASNAKYHATATMNRDWNVYRAEKWEDIEQYRHKHPMYNESTQRLILHEPYCCYCYRRSTQLETREKLQKCSSCAVVSFCTTCSQSHTPKTCQAFQQVITDERFVIEHHKRTKRSFAIGCTEKPRQRYIPLSTVAGWQEYYTKISDIMDTYDVSMDKEVRLIEGAPMAQEFVGLMRLATGTMTMALTILAALEKVFPNLSTMSAIRIHVIGAAGNEIVGLMVFKELLHLLPYLQILQLDLIGLDVPLKMVTQRPLKMECCLACSKAGRIRTVSLWRGAYHDYVKDTDFNIPDLGIAFQSGHSQEFTREWTPTIIHLARAVHPTVFTTFNKTEMLEETAILEKAGAHFILHGELNKWRALHGHLEALELREHEIYHQNQYWYIIGPKFT